MKTRADHGICFWNCTKMSTRQKMKLTEGMVWAERGKRREAFW